VYLSLSDRPTSGAAKVAAGGRLRRPVSRVVITLGFVSLLTDISSESVSAILPIYLTAVVGLSPVAYGFIDGLYQGVSALVRVAAGWGADRSDRPKYVAFLGYGLSMVARIFLLFASGLTAIAGVISADRIGKGIRTAPRDAMISAETPPEHLGRAFGVHRTMDTIGAAIGPMIAFLVLFWIPNGYHTVMVISLAFAILGVAMLGLLVPGSAGRRRQREASLTATEAPVAPRAKFRWRDVVTPALAVLLVTNGVLALLTVGDGFIYLALLDSGRFATHWFPVLYVGTNIVYLLLAVPLGRLGDRVGRPKVLIVGHLALAAAYFCAAAPFFGAATTLIALAMLGTFYAATDGVLAAVAGRLVPENVRTTGIASAQTVVAVARMFSAAGFGGLWIAFGPHVAMLGVALAVIVVVPFALVALVSIDEKAPAPAR
jgi:MFS family permease